MYFKGEKHLVIFFSANFDDLPDSQIIYIEHIAFSNMYVGFSDLDLWTCVIIF